MFQRMKPSPSLPYMAPALSQSRASRVRRCSSSAEARSQCTAVHPHQISTLQFANRKVRKVFRAEFFHVPVIPLQVCQQLVEPVLPLALYAAMVAIRLRRD